jgi:hypothetical protein
MPALQEIPAPVTMTERLDLEMCRESCESSIRCSGASSVSDTCTVMALVAVVVGSCCIYKSGRGNAICQFAGLGGECRAARTRCRGNAARGEGVARNKRLGLWRGAALFWNFRSVVRATTPEIKVRSRSKLLKILVTIPKFKPAQY